MPILRLAYTTQFLVALIAVFVLWSQVGGQGHVDLIPWYVKLALGAGAAYAIVKATISAVSREPAWNGGTLKWFGILIALLIGCGLVTYYVHVYDETDEDEDQQDATVSMVYNPIHRGSAEVAEVTRKPGESLPGISSAAVRAFYAA